jgi:N-acyl-D-amino-acid deacylase
VDRRDWVKATVLAGAAALHPRIAAGFPAVRARNAYSPDLVLRGGSVFDGRADTPFVADVAITGDRITALGQVPEMGAVEVNVSGLAVAPGFIDIHSHADVSLLVEPRAESRIRQGVTLEVVGQDGTSIGPVRSDVARRRAESLRKEFGIEAELLDLRGFFDAIDRVTPAVGVASMVGHGTVRGYVVGSADRTATAAELREMRALIRTALNQGAVGMSSGLEYTPGSFAPTEELVALAGELSGTGYPYASHMRNEDDDLLAAVEEAIHIGQRADVPVQISHLKAQGQRNYWKADAALRTIEAAARSGVDVHFDRYPYVAYATGLTNLFPAWARADGFEAFLGRLDDPGQSTRIERFARAKIALLGSWNAVQITSTSTDRNVGVRGRRLGNFAREMGEDPYALALRLLREERGGVGMVGFGMSEDNTAKILSHPRGMVCSDGGAYAPYGPLSTGSPHPRGYGTFPRVLGHYVRERSDLSLASAVKKMTTMPARKLQLADRGVLRVGAIADVTVFDPGTVADRATFESPHQYPIGIPHVIVNGVLTLRDGEHTGNRGGRAVRGAS